MKEFKDNDLIQVWNNLGWSVGYKTGKESRVWEISGSVKKIAFAELLEVTGTHGGRRLFEEGALLIKDNEVRERLNLPPLDKYTLDLHEMEELLKTEDIVKIEDFVQYCSNKMLDSLIQVAIKLPVKNLDIAKMLSSYSNTDVISAIEEHESVVAESNEVNTPIEKDKPRRKRIPKE
jgi:hypothetical protein